MLLVDGLYKSSNIKQQVCCIAYYSVILLLIPEWPGYLGQLLPETNAIPLLILIAIGIFLLHQHEKLRIFLPIRNLLLFLTINTFAISLFRPDILQSLRHGVAISLTLASVLFLTTLLHSISLQKALTLLSTLLSFTVLLSSVIHYRTVGEISFFVHNSLTRVGGLFFFADNAMIASIAILISTISLLLFINGLREKSLLVFNITICLIILASTDTRSAMLSLIFALSFLLSYSKVRRGLKIIFIVFVAFVLSVGFLYLNSNENRIKNLEKLMIRKMIWNASIEGIKERPLTGFGNKELYLQNDRLSRRINRKLDDAHNAHLMHMLTFGVFSWFIFITIIIKIIYIGLKYYKKKARILHSIIIYWFIVSFFWGRVFMLSGNVPQIIFLATLLGISCHPDAFRNVLGHKNHYIYRFRL